MLHLILKPTLILIVVSALALVGMHGQPNHNADLRALIVSPPGCAHPCWQGIEVGVTTREQAARLLQANPWVGHIYQSAAALTWAWSGQQPPEIDSAKGGLLQIGGDVVSQIRVQTLIPFGDVWLLLDRPDHATLVHPLALTMFSAYQVVTYNAEGMQAISTVDCPITPTDFWSTPITFGMGDIESTDMLRSEGYNLYQVTDWWPRLRYCSG